MQMIIRFFSVMLRPFQWLVYILSGLVLRKRNWYVFGEYGGTFRESTRFLAIDYASDKNLNVFWVCDDVRNMNLISSYNIIPVRRWTLKYYYVVLFSSKFFYTHYVNDISFWFSKGANKYNLWHGHPLKHIEHDFKKSKIYNTKSTWYYFYKFYAPWRTINDNYLMVNYMSYESIFLSAFNLSKDSLLKSKPIKHLALENPSKYFEQSEIAFVNYFKSIKKIKILYLPTFRNGLLERLLIDRIKKIFYSLSKDFECVVFYKLHPNTQDFELCCDFTNVFKIPDNIDPLFLFPNTDVLISDYSSLIIDFLQISEGKLCIDDFDIVEYMNSERDFYFEWSNIKACSDLSMEIDILGKKLSTRFIDNFHIPKARFYGSVYNSSILDLIKEH